MDEEIADCGHQVDQQAGENTGHQQICSRDQDAKNSDRDPGVIQDPPAEVRLPENENDSTQKAKENEKEEMISDGQGHQTGSNSLVARQQQSV